MARIFTSGAEWQSLADGVELTSSYSSPSISTAEKRSGAAAYALSGNYANDDGPGIYRAIGNQNTLYLRYYIKLANLVAGFSQYTQFYDGAFSNNAVALAFYKSGANTGLQVSINNFGSAVFDDDVTGQLQEWNMVELFFDRSGANGTHDLEVRLNGNSLYSASNLTLNITPGLIDISGYNGIGSTANMEVYIDDIAINDASGSFQNSWPGEGKIVVAVPSASGDNAPDAGTFASVNEIPPTDTATSSANRIELDTDTSIADFNVTDIASLGIESFDEITLVEVVARVREESAGTSNYGLRLKSASEATVLQTSLVDAGNATVRTNPNSTTNFGIQLIAYEDPTTEQAWTPTGTNSIENMQIGALTTDGTPDVWITAMAAMIEYVEGEEPPGDFSHSALLTLGVG